MKTRHDERYERDATPSHEEVARYREAIFDEDSDASLTLVSYRGGKEEFLLGKNYSESDDAGDRATGADILAQLGWSDQTFRDESIEILIPLLGDSDDRVVCCAAVALGHRNAESAIPDLLGLIDHPDSLVRYGVAFGLLGHEDPRAIAGLMQLAADEDRDVRNWSVFGLATQIETDSPAIREALRKALSDPDHEIRGEALVGLAKRRDPVAVPELINEWRGDYVGILSIEAAEEIGDPRLLDHLNQIAEDLTLDNDPHFASRLADAISACTPHAEQQAGQEPPASPRTRLK